MNNLATKTALDIYDIELDEELLKYIVGLIFKGKNKLKNNLRNCNKKKKEKPFDIGRYTVMVGERELCIDFDYIKKTIYRFIPMKECDVGRKKIIRTLPG